MKQIAFNGRILLRKIFTGLSLGAVAITFQACYGSPEVALNGTVRSADDEKPIPGISVSAYDENDYVLTGSRGQYHMLVMDWEQTIYFKDIDGEKNG
ncbi:MAG: hypothetical protein LBH97_02385, partial [Treponema sp.]|nr:hypothetical protein [Treponema sp.]